MSRTSSLQYVNCTGPVLAVEGGGTQTNCQLFMPGVAKSQASGAGGSCNPSTGFDSAVTSVEHSWAQVAQATGVARSEVALCLGCAGLAPDDVRQRFVAALPGFQQVLPLSDGYAALVGAGGGNACGMVVAGTGCAGHRMCPDGTSLQRDGWGWIGGDRGSGAWLGLSSLRYTLEAQDGLQSHDELSRLHLAELGKDNAEIAGWFTTCTPRDLAAQAMHVFSQAEAGLPRAQELLCCAAAELRSLFVSLGCAPAEPLYVAGSIAEALQERIGVGMAVKPQRPHQHAQEGCRLVAIGSAPLEWPQG